MRNLMGNRCEKTPVRPAGKIKQPQIERKKGYQVYTNPKNKKGMTITDHGFVQHSFNRNPAGLNPNSSLFFADCV
jgi:hypothetical protein